MKTLIKFCVLSFFLLLALSFLVDGMYVSTHILHNNVFESLVAVPLGFLGAILGLVIAGITLFLVFGAMFALGVFLIGILAIGGIVSFWPVLLIALVLYWIFSDSKQAKLNHN